MAFKELSEKDFMALDPEAQQNYLDELEFMQKSPEEQAQILAGGNPEPDVSPLQKGLEAGAVALRSGLSGLTLGASEPILSGVQAGLQAGKEAIQSGDISKLGPENLKAKYGEDVALMQKLRERYPTTAMGANIAGALVPQGLGPRIIAGVPQAVSNLAQMAGPTKAIAQGITANPIGSAIANIAGVGTGVGLVSGAENAIRGGSLDEQAKAAKESAKFGAGAQGILETVSLARKFAPKAAKTGLSILFGIDVPTQNKILKGEVNIRPELMDREAIDAARKGIGEQVKSSIDALDSKANVLYLKSLEALDASNKQIDMKSVLEKAQSEIGKRAYGSISKKITSPSPLLDEFGRPLLQTKNVTQQLDSLTPEAQSIQNKLENIVQRIEQGGPKVSASTAKKYISDLDASIDYQPTGITKSGKLMAPGSREAFAIRRELDDVLKKNVPEYDALTKPQAEIRNLRSMLVKRNLYNPDDIAKKTITMDRLSGSKDEKLIKALDEKAGSNISQDIKDVNASAIIARESTQGSRKVALFSTLARAGFGASAGALGGVEGGGPVGAVLGAGAGAVAGAGADKYGGIITNWLLQKAKFLNENPSINNFKKEISYLKIPEQRRQAMLNAYLQYKLEEKQNGNTNK